MPEALIAGSRAVATRRSFHVLAKPTGAICNLDCEYCFFLSKDALYPGSSFRMSDAVLEESLRQLLESQGEVATIAWQGGEPTMMGLDFFRRSVELVNRYRRPGQVVEYTIQTNGTLIDQRWADFLGENDVLVGISIDGPAALHDVYRRDKGGKPTFDRVLRGLDVLRASGVRWNALTTVNHANEDHGREVYRFLTDQAGAEYIQFIPVVERPTRDGVPYGERATARSTSPTGYGRFLVAVFDEWVRRDVGMVFVQMFDTTLANYLGVPPAMCVHSATCGAALALEHTGDVYPCDHFVEPAWLLGNITRTPLVELVDSARQRDFGLGKLTGLAEECRTCPVRFACHGGCPKDRFPQAPSGGPGVNYLCPGYRLFFAHVDPMMQFMARTVRGGGSADEVMTWISTAGRASD